jgi:DNA-binding PucR family transcriptional regulator
MTRGGRDADLRVLAPEARQTAEELAADLPALAQGMFEYLVAEIPEIGVDEETRGLTLASCSSSLEAGLTMLRHGIPADRAQAPAAALEHARHMAARGEDTNTTLRFYRLGHAWFWQLWVEALGRTVGDAGRLAEIVRESAAFSFAYLDAVSTRVSVELLAERDRRQRRIAAEREEVVAAIAAGEPVDPQRAEAVLGFAFAPSHVAFACWTEGDAAELERAAVDVAAALGDGRPLLVAHGAAEISGWVHVRDARRLPQAPEPPAGVRVALGTVASGFGGFRASHEEARRARRCAQLAGSGAAPVTAFADVRFLDLLSRDLPAARAFVAEELGGLAGRDERSVQLRDFLRTFLATGENATATAAALGLHRNTTRQRLARAEELLGRPVGRRGGELRAALALADALGDAVLPAD